MECTRPLRCFLSLSFFACSFWCAADHMPSVVCCPTLTHLSFFPCPHFVSGFISAKRFFLCVVFLLFRFLAPSASFDVQTLSPFFLISFTFESSSAEVSPYPGLCLRFPAMLLSPKTLACLEGFFFLSLPLQTLLETNPLGVTPSPSRSSFNGPGEYPLTSLPSVEFFVGFSLPTNFPPARNRLLEK